MPNQTLESFKQTVDWCLRNGVPVIKAFPLMLLRGTEVEQRRFEWGLVESDGTMPVVIQSDTFSHQEWLDMFRLSEALRATEKSHPADVKELMSISPRVGINMDRFRPKRSKRRKAKVRLGKVKRGCAVQEAGG